MEDENPLHGLRFVISQSLGRIRSNTHFTPKLTVKQTLHCATLLNGYFLWRRITLR